MYDQLESGQAMPFRRALLLTVLAALLSALMMFLPALIEDDGLLTLFADFDEQEIAFNVRSIETVKSGEFGFDWSVDLGTPSVGAFSFYTLGSPFFWLAALFPPSWFFYLTGLFYILKYVTAAATAFLFIRRHTSTQQAASFGALLYAFSGFNHINLMYYHFHDVVALFPLLLLAADLTAEKRVRGALAAAVAILALTNYFFLIAEIIFLIVYFFCFHAKQLKEQKRLGRTVLYFLAEGTLGLLLASVLLLPTFLFVIRNPRAGTSLSGRKMFFYEGRRYLQFLQALLYPAETFSHPSLLYDWDFSSVALYLPLTGASFAFASAICQIKRREEQTGAALKLLLWSASVMLVPVLNSLFYLGVGEYYARWFYMPILILSLLSAHALETVPTNILRRSSLSFFAFSLAFALILSLLPGQNGKNAVHDPALFAVTCGIALAGYALTALLLRISSPEKRFAVLFAALILFSVGTGLLSVTRLRTEKKERKIPGGHAFDYKIYKKKDILPQLLPNERLIHSGRGWNYGILTGTMTQNSFISTISPGLFRFYKAVGIDRYVSTPLPEPLLPLSSALSSRYVLQRQIDPPLDTDELTFLRSREIEGITVSLYENPYAVGIGFAHEFYLTREEWDRLQADVRQAALFKALIVDADEEMIVSHLLQKLSPEQLDKISWREAATARQQMQGYDVERDSHGYRLSFCLEKSSAVWFSIPNEPGWTATVNGEKTTIIDSVSMIALLLPEGTSRVELSYEMPGQKAGCLLSAGALLILLILTISSVIKQNKQRRDHLHPLTRIR